MTEKPTPADRRRTGNTITTGDVAILAIVVVVLLAVVGLGCAVLWDVINPSEWTAAGWAAVGAWISGTATFVAVAVALREGSRARRLATDNLVQEERRHLEQIREEQIRSDLMLASDLLPDLDKFATAMRDADVLFGAYSTNRSIARANAGNAEHQADHLDETPPAAGIQLSEFARYDAARESCADITSKLQKVRFALRVPSVRTAIDEAVAVVDLIGQQIHSWAWQVASDNDLTDPISELRTLPLCEPWTTIGYLYASGRLLQEDVANALNEMRTRNPVWDDDGGRDATMTW